MRFHTVLLIIVLVLMVAFGILNFNALMFPHSISLGFASYDAGTGHGIPLGMILLILAAVLSLVFYLLASYGNLRNQADSARLLREMQVLRNNLDTQEGSRFAELQTYLESRFAELRTQTSPETGLATFNARVDRVRDELSADIGQLEDYLRRKLGDSSDLPPSNVPPEVR